jgi:hypothetical protein
MTDQERRHLIQADRHIAECKDRITRQSAISSSNCARAAMTLTWHNPCSTPWKQVSIPSRRTGNSSLIG